MIAWWREWKLNMISSKATVGRNSRWMRWLISHQSTRPSPFLERLAFTERRSVSAQFVVKMVLFVIVLFCICLVPELFVELAFEGLDRSYVRFIPMQVEFFGGASACRDAGRLLRNEEQVWWRRAMGRRERTRNESLNEKIWGGELEDGSPIDTTGPGSTFGAGFRSRLRSSPS